MVVIERLHSDYHLAGGNIRPDAVKQKLDGIVRSLLVPELERRLPGLLPEPDRLYFVRNVRLDLVVDIGMRERDITAPWAERIASRLAALLRRARAPGELPAEESDCVVFRHETEYLAAFLAELAGGTAWSRWYFDALKEYDGMSAGDVIRTVLMNRADIAEDILMDLAERRELDEVLRELSEDDAELVFLKGPDSGSGAGDTREGEGENETRRDILEQLRTIRAADSPPPSSWKSCLKLYLAFLQAHPAFEDKTALRRVLAEVRNSRGALLQPTAVELALRRSTAEARSDGRKPDEKDIALVAAEHANSIIFARQAGLFLLVPALLELGVHEWPEKEVFPDAGGLPGLRCFLFLLARTLTAIDGTPPLKPDAAVFLLAGLEETSPWESLNSYPLRPALPSLIAIAARLRRALARYAGRPFSGLTEADIETDLPEAFLSGAKEEDPAEAFGRLLAAAGKAALRVFAERLPGFRKSSPAYLQKNFIRRPGSIEKSPGRLHAALAPMPMDVVLRMSGILDGEITVPWLDQTRLTFRLQEGGIQ